MLETIRMELARNLKVECVSRLRLGPMVCLPEEASVAEAIDAMRQQRVGGVLVCRAGDNALVGIFTERDLLRRILAVDAPLITPLSRCMTPQPQTTTLHEPVGVAVQRMQRGGYRHLPVVDEQGRPVGMLSSRAVVHYLVEHFPSTIYCLPPDPDLLPLQREGA
jgi:CBS domain-containing protein